MMKRKLTPAEKKKIAYKKDHRTHTGESDRGMRRTWNKRKAYLNRKYRRITDHALKKAIQPSAIDELTRGDDGTTRELIRKGLTREKNPTKWGVSSLRDWVGEKLESRNAPRETKRVRKERIARACSDGLVSLERDPSSPEAQRLRRNLLMRSGEVWDFLRDNPDWNKRLQNKIRQLQKEEQKVAERAKLKEQQKRKWRSPALRIPADRRGKPDGA
jgi:hypothetical protein